MTRTARPKLAILLIALAALALSLTAPPRVEAQQGSVPDRPTGVVTAATHDSVTLTWDDPSDSSITHYQIFRRDRDVHDVGEFVIIDSDTDSAAASYIDDTVEPNRRYVYRVKAVNAHGASRWSSFARANTPSAPPEPTPEPTPAPTPEPTPGPTGDACDAVDPCTVDAPPEDASSPTNLRVAELGADFLSLAWDAPDGGQPVLAYRLLRLGLDTDNRQRMLPVVENTGSVDTAYTVTGLDTDTSYVYWVQAIRAAGLSGKSAMLLARTGCAETGPCTRLDDRSGVTHVTDLTLSNVGSDRITLRWTAPATEPPFGYVVVRREAGGSQQVVVNNTESTDIFYADTGLEPETEYSYRVVPLRVTGGPAVNDAPSASATTAASPARPAAPIHVRFNPLYPVVEDSVALEWDPPQTGQVSGYQVLRRRVETTPVQTFTADAEEFQKVADIGDSDTTNWDDPRSTPGVRYAYTVRNVSDGGVSDDGNQVKITVPEEAPAAVAGLSAKTLDGVRTLTWSVSADGGEVFSYVVERCPIVDGVVQDGPGECWVWDILSSEAMSFEDTVDKDDSGSAAHYDPEQDYRYGVLPYNGSSKGVNGFGPTAYLEVLGFDAEDSDLPGAPANLNVIMILNDAVTLVWDAPEADDVTGYRVLRRGIDEAEEEPLTLLATVDDRTTYTDETATAGEAYVYHIAAVNGVGIGPISNSITVFVPSVRSIVVDPEEEPETAEAQGDGEPEDGSFVTGFTLIDTSTDTDLLQITQGAEIDLNDYETDVFSIRADISPSASGIDWVLMELSGRKTDYSILWRRPYTVFGYWSGDYHGGFLPVGDYRISITLYDGHCCHPESIYSNELPGLAYDFSVIDSDPPESVVPGTLRLSDGLFSSDGRLEIYHDSEWGSVCDDWFDRNDANVACRQLGYSGDTGVLLLNSLGPGRMCLDNLHCAGTESNLLDCPAGSGPSDTDEHQPARDRIGIHNCGVFEAVHIACVPLNPADDVDSEPEGAEILPHIFNSGNKPHYKTTGTIGGEGDSVDYYRFHLRANLRVWIWLYELDQNADLYIENSEGTQLYKSENDGSEPERIDQTLSAGTYFVRVEQDGGSENTYALFYTYYSW